MAENTITRLLGFGRANRTLRAYAYLTASFRTKARYDVADIVDCIIPFVLDGIADQVGNQLHLPDLAKYLQRFGLTVPIYVLEQMLPRLQHLGALEWNEIAHCHICLAKPADPNPAVDSNASALAGVFDSIEHRLDEFARGHGLAKPLVSASWTDALIAFLKSETAPEIIKTVKIREVIIGEPARVEAFLIGMFIQEAERHNKELFDQVVQVFTGILIEDFVNSIQSVGDPARYADVSIFYDTRVVLRLLGTSGKVLEAATQEMHRALQDLGCKTHFLDQTEGEAINIIETIISAQARGDELYGETADAINEGEVDIPQLRDLRDTLATRLGQLNVFPYHYGYAARKSEDVFQIDEARFARSLEDEAVRLDKNYSEQNARNDAAVVAIVLRLRKGERARDVAQSKCLFVSRNSLLQRVARRFVVEHCDYDSGNVPPVLTVGQIATIAWFVASKTLEPVKVTKELLANCYNAVRPNTGWAQEFANALENYRKGNPELFEERAKSAIFLGATRALAREESLGQAPLLRKINFAELLDKAAKKAEESERQARDAAASEEAAAEARGRAVGVSEQSASISGHVRKRALTIVAAVELSVIIGCVLGIVATFLVTETEGMSDSPYLKGLCIAILAIVLGLSVLDLFGLKPVVRLVNPLRQKLLATAERSLYRLAGLPADTRPIGQYIQVEPKNRKPD